MTQLIVSLEDASMLGDIKKAIRLLRGVVSVRESKGEPFELPDETLRRMERSREQYRKGEFVSCGDSREAIEFLESL